MSAKPNPAQLGLLKLSIEWLIHLAKKIVECHKIVAQKRASARLKRFNRYRTQLTQPSNAEQ